MSVSLTLDAVKARTKTVTRRHVDTWKNLRPGDRLTLIEKGMGLPKGAKQVVVAEVEIVGVDVVPLAPISWREVDREGFAGWTSSDFTTFWLESHGYKTASPFDVPVRRIEWRYVDGATR